MEAGEEAAAGAEGEEAALGDGGRGADAQLMGPQQGAREGSLDKGATAVAAGAIGLPEEEGEAVLVEAPSCPAVAPSQQRGGRQWAWSRLMSCKLQ